MIEAHLSQREVRHWVVVMDNSLESAIREKTKNVICEDLISGPGRAIIKDFHLIWRVYLFLNIQSSKC
jgi:hypothetical protein